MRRYAASIVSNQGFVSSYSFYIVSKCIGGNLNNSEVIIRNENVGNMSTLNQLEVTRPVVTLHPRRLNSSRYRSEHENSDRIDEQINDRLSQRSSPCQSPLNLQQ